LDKCLKRLNAGDVLVVWKPDWLGRSLRDLITLLDDLRGQGVKCKSLTEAIDTQTPTGRAMWRMVGVLVRFWSSPVMRGKRWSTIVWLRTGGYMPTAPLS
jgi:DNA invertase Pin-like site-specific DNA recombinase